MDIEKIEKVLNVKIIGVEEVRGRVFPLFDLVEVGGLRLVLISNPMFVVADKEDVHEMKIEGNYIVAETANGYMIMKYSGEPNIEALQHAGKAGKEGKELDRKDGEDGKQASGGDGENTAAHEHADSVREILEKLPKWSHGAVVLLIDGNVVVLPVKRSKKDGFYASTTWKPLEARGDFKELINHLITRDGKVIRVSVYTGNQYINIYTNRRRLGHMHGERRD